MVEKQQFRDAMARFAEAVTVVATDGPAGRRGFTATATASVSDSPPTLLVCAYRAGRSLDAVKRNGVFCVNLLAAVQQAVAEAFAGGVATEGRFAAARWDALRTGAPALEGALVALDCRLVEAKDVATHAVLFGEVVAVRRGPEQPALLYADRRYRSLSFGEVQA